MLKQNGKTSLVNRLTCAQVKGAIFQQGSAQVTIKISDLTLRQLISLTSE